jgi:hypothetical protein
MSALVLVARLGLRSIEAAGLQVDDLDWRAGRIVLRGKASREDGMPRPADVGDPKLCPVWASRDRIIRCHGAGHGGTRVSDAAGFDTHSHTTSTAALRPGAVRYLARVPEPRAPAVLAHDEQGRGRGRAVNWAYRRPQATRRDGSPNADRWKPRPTTRCAFPGWQPTRRFAVIAFGIPVS